MLINPGPHHTLNKHPLALISKCERLLKIEETQFWSTPFVPNRNFQITSNITKWNWINNELKILTCLIKFISLSQRKGKNCPQTNGTDWPTDGEGPNKAPKTYYIRVLVGMKCVICFLLLPVCLFSVNKIKEWKINYQNFNFFHLKWNVNNSHFHR